MTSSKQRKAEQRRRAAVKAAGIELIAKTGAEFIAKRLDGPTELFPDVSTIPQILFPVRPGSTIEIHNPTGRDLIFRGAFYGTAVEPEEDKPPRRRKRQKAKRRKGQ